MTEPSEQPLGRQIAAIQEWSDLKYGEAFSISACLDLLNVLKSVAPLKPKRWLMEERLPDGSIRWHCFEHEQECRAHEIISQHETTVTPLFAEPQITG